MEIRVVRLPHIDRLEEGIRILLGSIKEVCYLISVSIEATTN
jgi:hypothetical protein